VVVEAEKLTLAPCLGTQWGLTGAAGKGQDVTEDTALWATVDGRGRASLRPFDRIGFTLDVGLQVPLTRYSVVDQVSQQLYETSRVAFVTALGVFLSVS
jgi:hypothetical protein